MDRIFAFTDESGNTGYDFSKPNVSTHFIISAIMVTDSKRHEIASEAETIRKKYFQTGEMKSSSIGKKHSRRMKILTDLLKLDFKIFALVIDKRKIFENSGLRFKQSFYKFINNILHEELRGSFQYLTICADEFGTNEYMKSFAKYVNERSIPLNLFGETDFYLEDSQNNVLVQVADIISGTLSYVFDESKKLDDMPNYLKVLENSLLTIKHWPKDVEDYVFESTVINKEYDAQIAQLAYTQAQKFIEMNKNSDEDEIVFQIHVLKYLCFRFINNQHRKYIPTKELRTQLQFKTGEDISTHYFRTKIIAKLRDAGVLISSSSKGYKIPSNEKELYDFINHGTSVIMPMLGRLKMCRDIVKTATLNEVDLFDHTEYKTLNKFFSDIDGSEEKMS